MKYLALGMVATCLLSLPAHAQQQSVVCSSAPTPFGWSIVNYQTSFTSCGGAQFDEKVIENLSTLGSGASVFVCNLPGNIPPGWLVSDLRTISLACGDIAPIASNVVEIYNANGLGTGTTLRVCNFSGNIPSGWVVTNLYSNFTVCGDTSGAQLYDIVEIFNANGYRSGTTLNVCNFSNDVPAGWSVIGAFTNLTYCGDINQTLNNIITIRKN